MTDILTIGIPFFFVLAIVFGALEFSGVFKKNGIKLVISLAVAAITVTNAQTIELINAFLPYTAILFVIVFFARFLQKSFASQKHDWPLIMVVVGLVVILFARFGESFRSFFDRGPVSYENFLIGAVILAALLLFWAAYKRGAKKLGEP